MQNLQEHYATLKSNLRELRPLFATNGEHGSVIGYFDDTLEANEFEIALHALCSCLQSVPTLRITDADIERIDLLHQKMELGDNCVAALRQKQSESA